VQAGLPVSSSRKAVQSAGETSLQAGRNPPERQAGMAAAGGPEQQRAQALTLPEVQFQTNVLTQVREPRQTPPLP